VDASKQELTPVPNLHVRRGQKLLIVPAPGATWHIDTTSGRQGFVGADGAWERSPSNRRGAPRLFKGLPQGALVGQIGDGPMFVIGRRYLGAASSEGVLKVGCWDDDYHDNQGTMKVEISAEQ